MMLSIFISIKKERFSNERQTEREREKERKKERNTFFSIFQNISNDGEFSTIVDLLDSEDRDLVYATVGILVNLMSDPQQRPLFRFNITINLFVKQSNYFWGFPSFNNKGSIKLL
jgi:hypothetical protein